MTSCVICGDAEFVAVYSGPIRRGKFGEVSQESFEIVECRGCGVRALDGSHLALATFYESDEYRDRVDGAADAASYFKAHDGEQLRHLTAVGTGGFRGKVVADIGCGAGSFLHCVEGMAGSLIAIEPSGTFRDSLMQRGYATFPYAADALTEFAEQVDLAVSFSVLEHVEQPAAFLRDIHGLLKPGDGRLTVSTPNADDALLQLLPSDYPQFFYREAHLWYWTADALKRLLIRTGFSDVVVSPVQRFGLGNFMGWLRDRSPQGNTTFGVVTPAVDAVWRSELQRLGACDYLFATARA